MCLLGLDGLLLLILCNTHTHVPGLKGSSREMQRCLCQGQISHVSLLRHTDRSSQFSRLHEGQVHARRQGGKGGGRKGAEKSAFPFPPLSPCLMSPSSSPSPLLLSSFPLPLSTEESSRSAGSGSSLKVIQNCAARCLLSPPYLPPYPSRHPVYPPPPAPTPQPPGGGGVGWVGGWILLNSGKPCSKSQPGLSVAAPGLTGCPAAPQGQGRWEAWRGESRGGYEGLTEGSVGQGCVCSHSLLAFAESQSD